MAKKKRHSSVEIATKLAQADDLATQGKLKSEIAGRTRGEGDQIAELEFENSRLREQVIDLMLEKIKLEEADRTGFPRSVHLKIC
jgi:fructose 1,6-bisphosphatase